MNRLSAGVVVMGLCLTHSANAQLRASDRCLSVGFTDQLTELEATAADAIAKAQALLDECTSEECRAVVTRELENLNTQANKLTSEQARCRTLKEQQRQ